MNINRTNYEEYFLRYADHELSAEEKAMVDAFVKENEDLEEELVMLQQSVVKPDLNIVMKDKHLLFRDSAFVNLHNYEEKLVLLNDQELSREEASQTMEFINRYSLQKESGLFERLKLEPDTSVVFPDKTLLYKKEENGKVFPIVWWRYMAAAVVLGFGIWFGSNYLISNIKPPVAINDKSTPPLNKVGKTNHLPLPASTVNTIPKNTEAVAIHKERARRNNVKVLQERKPANDVMKGNELATNQKPVKEKQNKPQVNETPVKEKDLAVLPGKIEDKPVRKITNNLDKPMTNELQQDRNMTVDPPNLYAQTASNTTSNNDNYVFYNVTTEEFKKSRLGGFLKKIKRNIVRRSPFNRNNGTEVAQQ